MPQVLQWPNAGGDPSVSPPQFHSPVIETCRQTLLRGELIALPTEAGYVIAASTRHAEAIARLAALRSDPTVPLPTIAVRGADDARDWVPDLGLAARRLARRCWPGPVVFFFAYGAKTGAASRLSDGVLRTIAPGWELGLTAPHHPAVRAVLEAMPSPVALGELASEPATIETILALGDAVALAVDTGRPAQFDRSATTVEIRGDQWSIRREGAISGAELSRLAAKLILFICTGNTCRSPLAAALCKKRLADQLSCSIEDLPGRGFVIASAGLAALRGKPAAAEAIAVARELGADLSDHESQPATAELLADADMIVGMTAGHVHGLAAAIGVGQVELLCGDADLPDPIGGDAAVYQACAGTIWQHLKSLIEELVPSSRG